MQNRLDGSFCDFREAVTDCSQDGIRLEALGSLPEVALLPQPILYQQTKARGLDFSVVSSDAGEQIKYQKVLLFLVRIFVITINLTVIKSDVRNTVLSATADTCMCITASDSCMCIITADTCMCIITVK